MSSTVERERSDTKPGQVNTESGFWSRWRQRSAPTSAAATADRAPRTRSRGEHAPGNVEPLPQRTPRTDPDDVAANMIVKLGRALQPGHHASSTALLAALDEDIVELHRRANREAELGRSLLRRDERATAAVGTAAAAIEAAVQLEVATGVPAQLDTAAIGAGIAKLTANAHAPEQSTMQFPVLTPGALAQMDARRETAVLPQIDAVAVAQPASAVSVPGENLRPPIPVAGEAEAAVHPLPQRVPHLAVIAAPVAPDGSPKHGHKVDPATEADFGSGDWVFRGADDKDGGPVYRQVATVDIGDSSTCITYRNEETQTVRRGNTVRVLSQAEARELLAQYGVEEVAS